MEVLIALVILGGNFRDQMIAASLKRVVQQAGPIAGPISAIR